MDGDIELHHEVKRRKLNGDPPAIKIASASDLHNLLSSQQGSQSEVKKSLQQFKEFLEAISQSENKEDRTEKLQILKVYAEEQLSPNQESANQPDLISIWTTAVANNDESILSLVPSVLALYLQIISCHPQHHDTGLALCQNLLLKDQLRLFDRGLTATKTKEHLISPCLQVLTEIVCFDGGEIAGLVYSKRDTTFKRLELFLGHRTQSTDTAEYTRQRPTLRRIAQRYLLANLKFQSASAKGDIIAQGKILRSCLQSLRSDQADIIYDVLASLENDIVRAGSLPKDIKSRLFTPSNLFSLASLFTFTEPVNEVSSGRSVRNQVDTLLRLICTQQESGVLQPQSGWYPVGSNPHKPFAVAADPNKIDLGIESCFYATYREKFAVKNGTLSTFILGLKPELDRLQASLILDIFRVAPELVADYFSKKTNFITEPKDTPAWLGQSAFLFSAIQLPVPAYCGWRDKYPPMPPPTSVVIESIIPLPLDRPTITRALNLNHEVITLFAVRAVTVAFQKLTQALEVYRAVTSNAASWKQASSDLVSAFSRRCPSTKDVLSTFQRTPKSDEQLRGSVIELLTKYYENLPHLLQLEKFDISLALIDATERVSSDVEDQSLQSSRFFELGNLLKIAHMSPDTRWWQKPDSKQYSVFTCMLKAVIEADQSKPAIPSIRDLLQKTAAEDGILVNDSDSFDALVTSLTKENDWIPGAGTMSFFDNCACRIARQPVHYQDIASRTNASGAAICLLPFCIVEQWPFVTRSEDLDEQENIAEWITRLLALLARSGKDTGMTHELHSQIQNATIEASLKKTLKKSYTRRLGEKVAQMRPKELKRVAHDSEVPSFRKALNTSAALDAAFERSPKAMESMEGLERLDREDLEVVVAKGRLGRLCRSLSSSVEETRKQGFVTLQAVTKQIELSSHSEKGPLYILIGEILETAKAVGFASPLATIFTEFAAEAVEILSQPSHPMYGKVNKLLQKSPSWNLSKFVTYWDEKVLLREPEDDRGHPCETTWLLKLLIRGLRDDQDMELYRKSNIFDRVLALYRSSLCSDTHRRQILGLLYHCIKLGGGMTLVTRVGIESWFDLEQDDGQDQRIIKELGDQLHDCVDTTAVQHWRYPMASGAEVP